MIATTVDKLKMTDSKTMEIKVPKVGKKSYSRMAYIAGAVVAVSVIVVAAILGALYAGHVITRSAYKDVQLNFRDDDGKFVMEEVSISEKQVKFNAPGKFAVVYDYENMLAVIRTYDEDNSGRCCVTKLTADMGSIDGVMHTVAKAMSSGGILTSNGKSLEFIASNATVDGLILNTEATELCGDLPVGMLVREENVADNRRIVKRAAWNRPSRSRDSRHRESRRGVQRV